MIHNPKTIQEKTLSGTCKPGFCIRVADFCLFLEMDRLTEVKITWRHLVPSNLNVPAIHADANLAAL
eukprot:375331-Amphidinium_carterae.2